VKDIHDLLVKPQQISKQIDFLIRRAGKPTTYRSTRTLLSGYNGAPPFQYDWFYGEYMEAGKSIETNLVRKVQLDMVINTTFQFPGINQPTFRADLFYEKAGFTPRITDLYNLTPWSWLLDWFTGMGNYIEIIDEVNHDRSLINWGFLTGKSSVQVTSNIQLSRLSYSSNSFDGVGVTTEVKQTSNHSSVLDLQLQFRRDLGGMLDVQRTSEPGSLNPYQKSILGALIAQRTKFTRI
jgi:hypothetical protein